MRLPTYPPANAGALYREIQAWTRRANEIDPPSQRDLVALSLALCPPPKHKPCPANRDHWNR